MAHNFNRFLIFAACAVTTSLFTVGAQTACVSGNSLASYISLGTTGCIIGDKIFNDFGYSGTSSGATGGTTQPTAGQIAVTTLGPSGSGANELAPVFPTDIGLLFNSSWNANGDGTFSDGFISFEVTVVNGAGYNITDAGLYQTDNMGPGTATVGEAGCSGSVYPCTQTWGVATNAGTFISDTIFSPTGTLSVTKDINVAGAYGGTTSISGVEDIFSQSPVPEPRTTALVLGLLLAGLVFRKKYQTARS